MGQSAMDQLLESNGEFCAWFQIYLFSYRNHWKLFRVFARL